MFNFDIYPIFGIILWITKYIFCHSTPIVVEGRPDREYSKIW